MRYINDWVVSLVLRRQARDFFYIRISRGIRQAVDTLLFEDNAVGIYWMIPLSSRIDKFRKIIDKKEHTAKVIEQKARKVLENLKQKK